MGFSGRNDLMTALRFGIFDFVLMVLRRTDGRDQRSRTVGI
jgi:hypothetical protein